MKNSKEVSIYLFDKNMPALVKGRLLNLIFHENSLENFHISNNSIVFRVFREIGKYKTVVNVQ